jgi:hypothetical protein
MTRSDLRPEAVWTVLRGPIRPTELRAGVTALAARHQLRVLHDDAHSLLLASDDATSAHLTLRWRPYTPSKPDTLSHVVTDTHLEILLDHQPQAAEAACELAGWLDHTMRRFQPAELERITATMPLLTQFTPVAAASLTDWAIIVRDHYVENTLGLLLALRHAGMPPQWIYALAKGDRTHNRDRVHATLRHLGYRSGLLDNTTINAPDEHAVELAAAMTDIDAFVDAAHAAGRRVLAIDDGGLLAQDYGRVDSPRRIDAAVELTVSGLKRISAAGPLDIPVLNLARSQLKTRFGYPEIADSCLRRLRALLPAVKLIGRTVLVLGYGTLGSRLATALAGQGCQIHVADPDPLALIAAAEAGHTTHRDTAAALRAARPVLIVATSGADALTAEELPLLPDGVFLAPFATRDFSLLADPQHSARVLEVPGVGRRYQMANGHQVTLLGDGRSLNLFETDAIPNQGYDAFRAGTLIAAAALCKRAHQLPAGVHVDLVDEIIREAGLYEAYYDTYLTTSPQPPPPHRCPPTPHQPWLESRRA